jgi:ribonuclease HII
MIEQDALYPEYGFVRNKGYGTAEHIAALKKYGPCPIHRRTFIGKFL